MIKKTLVTLLAIALCIIFTAPASAEDESDIFDSLGSITNVTSVSSGMQANEQYIQGIMLFSIEGEILRDDEWDGVWDEDWTIFGLHTDPYIGLKADGGHMNFSAVVTATYRVTGSTTITFLGGRSVDGFSVIYDDSLAPNVVSEVEYGSAVDGAVDWDVMLPGSKVQLTAPGIYFVGLLPISENFVSYAMVVVEGEGPAITVSPTPSTVFVNDTATEFEAYLIDGYNFFKLRDLAYVLNGTLKQFAVGWNDETQAITLTSGRQYFPTGDEIMPGDGTAKTARRNAAINISKDGEPVTITAYLIEGYNFMRLRDVLRLFDVGVIWDETANAVRIDTGIGYSD